MECNICYFYFLKEDFFELACCKNNLVCKDCIDLLLTPQCPFCRTHIQGLSEKRMATSYSAPTQPIMNTSLFIDPYDDIYIDSRTLRRQMKRIRKLQERERDKLNNQNLMLAYKLNKQANKKEINQDMKEQLEIFQLD